MPQTFGDEKHTDSCTAPTVARREGEAARDNESVTEHAEEEATSTHDVMLSGPPRHRRRRARTMFDDRAIRRLDAIFQVDQYPDIAKRDELAQQLGVSEARIQTWFQNKRSRTKRHIAVRRPMQRSQPVATIRQGQPPNDERSSETSVISTANRTGEEGSQTMTSFTGRFPVRAAQGVGTKHVLDDSTPTILPPSTNFRHETGNRHQSAFVPNRRRATSFEVSHSNITAVNCPWFCPYVSYLKSPAIHHPISEILAPSRDKEMLTFFPAFLPHSPLAPMACPLYAANHFIFPPKLFRYSRPPASTLANAHQVSSAIPMTTYLTNAVAQAGNVCINGVQGAADEDGEGGETAVGREGETDDTTDVSAPFSRHNSRDSDSPINVCD